MFTAVEDQHHASAHFELLPFVVGILGEGSIARKGSYLPVGDPNALTFETIEAMEDIPLGHKLALKEIDDGDTVIKYGHDIGRAVARTAAITA